MKTQVQKWGNSLALRIPQSFAAEVKLAEGTQVEVSLIDGKLVIHLDTQLLLTLEDLLRSVTDENIHGEWDTGPVLGREIW